jgi:hypothetical protein
LSQVVVNFARKEAWLSAEFFFLVVDSKVATWEIAVEWRSFLD